MTPTPGSVFNREGLMLDDQRWSHKAWMSELDAQLFERVVIHKSKEVDATFAVLEWGSGRSTVYFTDLLQKSDLEFSWLSLEYDRDYFRNELEPIFTRRAKTRIFFYEEREYVYDSTGGGDAQVELIVFNKGKLQPFLHAHYQDRFANLDDYVSYPRTLERQFDLIIVDGRKRRRCLLEASSLLKPRGVTILHDAYRGHYHCAFEHYRSQRMLGEILWIGSLAATNFLEWIL